VTALGSFGPEGFTGRLNSGQFGQPGDAIIVGSSSKRTAARLQEDGEFRSGPDDLLAAGQFLSGGFLDDLQRRRQEMYQELFAEGKQSREYERPTLLFWADPLDTGFSFPDVERRVGSALVHVPLSFERAPAGTELTIPPTFFGMSAVAGSESRPGSLFTYDEGRDSWPQSTSEALTWMRFGLPAEILPVELTEAELTLQINAPSRPLKIHGFADEEAPPLAEQESPIGTFTFTITEPSALKLDAKGGLILGIDVGEVHGGDAAENPDITWRIEDVRLQARGRSLER
jgi:hypothetical protein